MELWRRDIRRGHAVGATQRTAPACYETYFRNFYGVTPPTYWTLNTAVLSYKFRNYLLPEKLRCEKSPDGDDLE